MNNGSRVLIAVLNCMYKLKFLSRHSTIIVPSLIARGQSIAASIQKLSDSVVKSVSTAGCRQRRCFQRKDQIIFQFEVSCQLYTRTVGKR
jgi:hypothetical protein